MYREKTSKQRDIIASICISGVLLAIILLFQFAFENVKVFGGWGIQIFLIIYAFGIYKINNLIVNIFFLLITPVILFFLENGIYSINFIQTFFEYFLVYYVFFILIVVQKLFIYLNRKFNFKYSTLIDTVFFITTFFILIVIKYFLHAIASLTWWDLSFWSALSFNSLWFATNILLIPISVIVAPLVFRLFYKVFQDNMNKW